jgi:hypothetical protein
MRRALALSGMLLVGAGLAAACGADTSGLFGGNPTTTTSGHGAGGAGAQGAAGGGGAGATGNSTSSGGGATGGAGGGGSPPTGGGGAGAIGGGGTGGAPGETDCMDGVDDDDNGLTDCEDPHCGAFECVPAYVAPAQAPFDYSFPVGANDPYPAPSVPASRDACQSLGCGCQSQPGTCDPWADVYDGDACGVYVSTKGPGCYNPNFPYPDRSFIGGAQPNGSGSCLGGLPQFSPTPWRACNVAQPGYCPGAEVCVPRNAAATAQCILQQGQVTCADPYSSSTTLYDPALSACSCYCSVTSEDCSPPTMTVYHDQAGCAGGSTTALVLDGNCQAGGVTASYSLGTSISFAHCDPQMAPVNPVPVSTLCCLP